MANPKKKHTPMRRDMRRSANSKMAAPGMSFDTKAKEYHTPHRVSPNGYYNGELVLPPKTKKKKADGE